MGKKVKINFYVSEEVMQQLKKKKEQTGAPISEIIRRAILQYFDKKESE